MDRKRNKVVIPLLTAEIIASQLMGCGSTTPSEFMDAVNNRQAVEVMVEITEDMEQGTLQETSWEQLDRLNTYSTFRRNYDDALGITKYGTDSKNGILYADLEGNHEGNNTLYNGFANNKFRDNYWNNEKVQSQVQKYAAEQFADVAADTDDAKMAALNAYYSLFADAAPNFFNGSSLVSRAEFMTGLFKAETQAGTVKSDTAFSSLVGSNKYTDFAAALAPDSYLDVGSKSLNDKTFNGTITRGEAVYMLVSHYYSDELAGASGKSDKVDVKNAGDVETKQEFTGDYARSYELVYCMQNAEKGAPDEIYRALQVAYDKGILSDGTESRWEEGLTKTEALELITSTYMSMSSVHGVEMGKGDGEAIEIKENKEIAKGSADMTSTTSEVFTEAEEEIVKQEVEQGLLEVPEDVAIRDLDEYRYTTTDVSLREKASVGAEKLDTVAIATKVHVNGITEDGQWCRVDGVNGKDGFISAAYLQTTVPTTEQKQADQQQKDQQADLEQQAQENQQQQQSQGTSQSDIQSFLMSGYEGTSSEDLSNIPSSQYVGESSGRTDVHAE